MYRRLTYTTTDAEGERARRRCRQPVQAIPGTASVANAAGEGRDRNAGEKFPAKQNDETPEYIG
jgi:hypothetical protein